MSMKELLWRYGYMEVVTQPEQLCRLHFECMNT